MIEVLQPGALTTVQDLGRNGFEQYGIPRCGPFDPFLATIANRLAGNDANVPLLEFALAGPTLRFSEECFAAIAGPHVTYLLNDAPIPVFRAFRVAAGATLQFQKMDGWFAYLAIGGGLNAPETLGSVSTYLAGHIGSRLQKGDRLRHRASMGLPYSTKDFTVLSTIDVVKVLPGLHFDIFQNARQLLVEKDYTISNQSNRMGIRLIGSAIECAGIRRSVPALAGTVQINRSGQPMILGPEGPTTGGYAQIANLCSTAWTALAFAGPGKAIRFEWATRAEARRLSQERQDWLRSFRKL